MKVKLIIVPKNFVDCRLFTFGGALDFGTKVNSEETTFPPKYGVQDSYSSAFCAVPIYIFDNNSIYSKILQASVL